MSDTADDETTDGKEACTERPRQPRPGDLRHMATYNAQLYTQAQAVRAQELQRYSHIHPWKPALWFCLPMVLLSLFALTASLLGVRSYLNAHPDIHISGANYADLLDVTGPPGRTAGRWFVFFIFSVGCGVCWLIILPIWVWEFGRRDLRWIFLEQRL